MAGPDRHGTRGRRRRRARLSTSASNRALILAAIADGPSTITGLLDARDTQLMIAGLRLLGNKKYHAFAQGLIGGGIATLYFSAYAAHHSYGMIGMYPAFALMACITLSSGIMAVGFNSLLIAILGILGGLARRSCSPAGSATARMCCSATNLD